MGWGGGGGIIMTVLEHHFSGMVIHGDIFFFGVTGAFFQCAALLLGPFSANCMYDGCATLPNQEYICDTIIAAEHICRSSGVPVGSWRSSEVCGEFKPTLNFKSIS